MCFGENYGSLRNNNKHLTTTTRTKTRLKPIPKETLN